MTNPIQQLVETLRRYYNPLADECGDHCTHNCRECQARSAILAVESADVETRWEVQRSFGEDRWETWHLSSLKEAQELLPVIVKEYPNSEVFLVRLDTYRTVEKEQ